VNLPPSWTETTLGEVAETKLGKMLSAKSKVGANPRPYLRNKNVQWGRIDVDDLLRMDFSDEEFVWFRVRPGDLLVCEGGEVGRAAIWRDSAREIAFQKALHRIRPRAEVTPEFLLYLLMWFSKSNAFERFVTGSTIKHLPQEDLRRLPMPLPPLAEQRRIVAAIEEQFSRLDAAEATLRGALLRIEGLRRAVLDAALSAIKDHRPLGALASTQLGKMLSSKAKTGQNSRPYLRNKNVRWYGFDLDDLLEMDFSESERAKFSLTPGDVIVCEGGEVGRAAVWQGQLDDCYFQKAVHRVRPHGELDSDFLVHVLRWFADTNAYERYVTGSTINHLPQEDLRTLPIPAPPLDEQRRIVAELGQQLSLIDSFSAAVESAQKRSAALRRAILERAFRGELVPQDPDDEPASVLLERIRAERAAAPKPSRRRATMKAS
jgi:type I restriction enzyme, S subunit